MKKAKKIKEATTPYLCKASIKRALLTALQIEADKAEVGYPLPSIQQGVYSDLLCAAEAFLAALIGQWEARISLKKPRPRTMLAGDVQLALGILYSDVEGAATELKALQEGADMKLLNCNFSTRAIRLNMIRAASGIYTKRDDAVQLVKRILWGRFLGLARRTIHAFQDGQTCEESSPARCHCIS